MKNGFLFRCGIYCLAAFYSISCSQESKFEGKSNRTPQSEDVTVKPPPPPEPPAKAEEKTLEVQQPIQPEENSPENPEETAADAIVELTPEVVTHELKAYSSFEFVSKVDMDAKAAYDFLFIIDNSSSMARVSENLRLGYESIGNTKFPENSKIAVLSSMPTAALGSEDISRTVANKVRQEGIHLEPGFKKPFNDEALQLFLSSPIVPQKYKNQYVVKKGCGEWFAPDELNEDGESCFKAHTQFAWASTGVEALSYSLVQYIDRFKQSAFRPGSHVNVIFITDTHFVGIKQVSYTPAQLKAPIKPEVIKNRLDRLQVQDNSPKDWQGMLKVAEENLGELTKSFKLHAIAPETEKLASPGQMTCTEAWVRDGYTVDGKPYYNNLARESGGVALDICENTDYGSILEKVIASAVKEKVLVVDLPAPISEDSIVSVYLDQEKIEDWTYMNDSQISLKVSLEKEQKITVFYK